MTDDIYIQILKWAKDNGRFTSTQITEKFPSHRELIVQEMAHSTLFTPTKYTDEYFLSFEDRFRLLEHEELQEARQNSKNAMFIAILSIFIAFLSSLSGFGEQALSMNTLLGLWLVVFPLAAVLLWILLSKRINFNLSKIINFNLFEKHKK